MAEDEELRGVLPAREAFASSEGPRRPHKAAAAGELVVCPDLLAPHLAKLQRDDGSAKPRYWLSVLCLPLACAVPAGSFMSPSVAQSLDDGDVLITVATVLMALNFALVGPYLVREFRRSVALLPSLGAGTQRAPVAAVSKLRTVCSGSAPEGAVQCCFNLPWVVIVVYVLATGDGWQDAAGQNRLTAAAFALAFLGGTPFVVAWAAGLETATVCVTARVEGLVKVIGNLPHPQVIDVEVDEATFDLVVASPVGSVKSSLATLSEGWKFGTWLFTAWGVNMFVVALMIGAALPVYVLLCRACLVPADCACACG